MIRLRLRFCAYDWFVNPLARNSFNAREHAPPAQTSARLAQKPPGLEQLRLALSDTFLHVQAVFQYKTNTSMKSLLSRLLFTAAIAVTALGLGACATTTTTSGPRHSFTFDPPALTPKNPGAVKVKLSTGAQRLYVVEGDTVLLATPVMVGTAKTPTPPGNFTIYSKQAHRRRASSPGAGYPMTYWMEFKSAYGMHWGFVKPYPGTHGCVRIPLKAAKKVYDLVRVGTPLNIASSQPWDQTIGKELPVLDDSRLPDPPMSYMLSSQVFSDAQQGKHWNF
jgi:hypothetical protein